ncbi:MAG: hypothetical protein KDA92_13925 [Planctomycetales bacterium]|nr:hypothetical protein [Planctomycetales bacterium]
MSPRKNFFKPLFVSSLVAIILAATSPTHAQYFQDDFEDGSATDGNPVTWSDYPPPFNLGTFAVVDGDLVITPATTGPVNGADRNYREKDVVVANRLFHDVNVLARVRALTDAPSIIGIGTLDTHFADNGIGMSVNSSIVFDGARRYLLMNYENNLSTTRLGLVDTNISQSASDVNLRVAIAGDVASFSVWADEEAEPTSPQLQRKLPRSFQNTEGQVVIWAGNADGVDSPVAFRSITVVPEPSAAMLGSVAYLALLSRVRRCRNPQPESPRRFV